MILSESRAVVIPSVWEEVAPLVALEPDDPGGSCNRFGHRRTG